MIFTESKNKQNGKENLEYDGPVFYGHVTVIGRR
jgi:hypothetical protein